MRSEELKRYLIGLYFKIWDDWVQGTLTCHTFMSHSVLDIYCTPAQTELCNLVGSNSIRVFVCNSCWNVYLHLIASLGLHLCAGCHLIAHLPLLMSFDHFLFLWHKSCQYSFCMCEIQSSNIMPLSHSQRFLFSLLLKCTFEYVSGRKVMWSHSCGHREFCMHLLIILILFAEMTHGTPDY